MKYYEQVVDNEEINTEYSITEDGALKTFQTSVASALLSFSECELESLSERRLASALLFLTHLSSEITRGFSNGDEKIAMSLLTDAIIESRRAYKSGIVETGSVLH